MIKLHIVLSFLFGVLVCTIGHYFLYKGYRPFPHFANKYKYKAILTPAKHIARIKAKGNYPTMTPPKTLIVCYDEKFFNNALKKHKNKQCDGQFGGLYFLTDHPSVAFIKLPIFGPGSAMRLEQLIAWGVRQVIAIGTSCGFQKDIKPGDILVCERSIRDEGFSHHYLPYSKYAYPSAKLQKKLLLTLKDLKVPYKIGTSWATDAFYRTTKEEVEHYQKEGVLCIDAEGASLLSVAKFRNIDMVVLFTITDSYANLEWEKALYHQDKKIETLNKMLEIALMVINS
jgi:uridine phosphorylase